MSAKIVVRAEVHGNAVTVTKPNGETTTQALTDRVKKKLGDLPYGYFYATEGPQGLNLKRLAPFAEWQRITC